MGWTLVAQEGTQSLAVHTSLPALIFLWISYVKDQQEVSHCLKLVLRGKQQEV